MRKAVNKLFLVYYSIYFVAVLAAVLGFYLQRETGLLPEYSKGEVGLSSFYIIVLLLSIPLSLRLFNDKVKKLAVLKDEKEKVAKYTKYALFRLVVIGGSLLVGILLFYLTRSQSMMLCAGVAAIALVFCKPSEVKMAAELESFDAEE